MRTNLIQGVSLFAISAAMLVPNIASAQTAPESTTVDEVVVTASRRSERLMEVPMAVSAVTEQEVKDSGAVTTRDLGQLAPGLTSTTNGFSFQPAIRGISSAGTGSGDEQNVALYVDGVYMAVSSGNVINLKNIERIEVLKGPQGTLFGRNATGGAIRIITKDPSPTPELEARLAYGTELRSKDYTVYASTPLGDTLGVSFSGNIYDDKGYVENLLPGWNQGKLAQTHSWIGRLKFVWAPTENFKATLAGDVSRYQSDTSYALAPYNNINSLRNTPGYISINGPYKIAYNLAPTINVRTSGVSLAVTYDFLDYTLESTTAYRTHKLSGILDNDRTNFANSVFVSSRDDDWFSQEALLTSNYDGPLNFIAGLYYFRLSGGSGLVGYSGPVTGPGGSLVSFGTQTSSVNGYVDTHSVAGFGEVSYQLTSRAKVIGGVRYTTESKTLFTNPIQPVRAQLRDEEDWNNWSYRVTGQYDLTDDSNVYATWSTGFKSGVYNPTSTTFVQKVEPETVNAIEVGAKARLNRVDLTLSAYHYRYENIQVQANNFIAGSPTIVLTNAAEAEMTGVELELTARVTPNLRVRLGTSYLPTAKYTNYVGGLDSVPKGYPGSRNPSLCPSSPQCGLGNDQIIRDGITAPTLDGTRIIRAPEFTANLGLMYERDLPYGSLQATANYFYTSEFYWVAGEHISQEAYSVLNGTIGWSPPGERYKISVFSRNLGDEVYGIYNSPNAAGTSVAYAAPREIGVSLDIKF